MTLDTWNKYRGLLAEAVVRLDMDGFRALRYCFDYSVRAFLDGFMHAQNVPTLQVTASDSIDDLLGPDQANHREHLKRAFNTNSVTKLVSKLQLSHSVHLLLGIACMVLSLIHI